MTKVYPEVKHGFIRVLLLKRFIFIWWHTNLRSRPFSVFRSPMTFLNALGSICQPNSSNYVFPLQNSQRVWIWKIILFFPLLTIMAIYWNHQCVTQLVENINLSHSHSYVRWFNNPPQVTETIIWFMRVWTQG